MSNPFTLGGPTATISATNTTSSATLNGTSGTIRVYNSGVVAVFITSGTDAATATTSHLPVAPGGVECFSIPQGHKVVAAITASGTATVYVSRGDGI